MLLLLLNLLACTDYTMVGKPSEQDILAFPSAIDFGHLVSGQETGVEQLVTCRIYGGNTNVHSDIQLIIQDNSLQRK